MGSRVLVRQGAIGMPETGMVSGQQIFRRRSLHPQTAGGQHAMHQHALIEGIAATDDLVQ